MTEELFFTDGYRDRPLRAPRAALEHELRRLKMMRWADPGDDELRARIAALEAELRGFDRASTGGDAA